MAGTLVANTINTDTGLFSTNNAYNGIAKAWCIYNGATQTVLNSFNISSVTYGATGNYTFNFTTAMPSANYCVSMCGSNGNASGLVGFVRSGNTAPTASAVYVGYTDFSSTPQNGNYQSIAIFA